VKNDYFFYIRVETEGAHVFWLPTSGKNLLQIICGSGSVNITQGSDNPTPQKLDVNSTYLLPTFVSSNPACPVIPSSTQVSDTDGSINVPANFLLVDPTGGSILTVDTTLEKIYTFWVKVSAEGGFSDWFGPFEYHYGCTENLIVSLLIPSNVCQDYFYIFTELAPSPAFTSYINAN
jgi:hypothetical protein